MAEPSLARSRESLRIGIGRRPVVMAGLSLTPLTVFSLTFVGNPTVFVAGISVLGFALFAVRPGYPRVDDGSRAAAACCFGHQSPVWRAIRSTLTPIIGGFIDTYGLLSVFYFLAATILVANVGVPFLLRHPA